MSDKMTFGFARMHVESGERRDFLPVTIARLERLGVQTILEHGYGSGMGFTKEDYQKASPSVIFTSHEEVYQQEYVIVLRCPDVKDLEQLRKGSCLISMLHYPTRSQRTAFLKSLEIEACSLDSIKGDIGRRLVENLRSVAWNGVEAAIRTLRTIYPSPGFDSPNRKPIKVTLLGSGAVGLHVTPAAIRYGDPRLWQEMTERGVPGIQVTTVDYDTTRYKDVMLELLAKTDILVDATQRPDPSIPVIPNEWISVMPKHAVLLDLSVDPYICDTSLPSVKGIEGVPQGNLDQYVFAPDDPVYNELPDCIPTINRRYAISCYSWPGIHPRKCMAVYGKQLSPIFRTIIQKGGIQNIDSNGRYFERAISRAMLSSWQK
jgi:alanine dehydrogenase